MTKEKKQLIKDIEAVEINYNLENTYNSMYNLFIDYWNNTQDFILEDYFNDYISNDTVEEIIKRDLEEGGLARLKYFIEGVDLNKNLYRLDGYGNLENITEEDLECLKYDLLNELKR